EEEERLYRQQDDHRIVTEDQYKHEAHRYEEEVEVDRVPREELLENRPAHAARRLRRRLHLLVLAQGEDEMEARLLGVVQEVGDRRLYVVGDPSAYLGPDGV